MLDKIFGGIIIAIPFLNHVYRGISEFEVLFICMALLSMLIILHLITDNTTHIIHFGIFDLLVSIYLTYGLFSNLFIRQLETEPLFYFKWGVLILIYIIVRKLSENYWKTILISIIISGFIQAVVAYLQILKLLGSSSVEFPITGSFSNPGHLGVYLAISIVALLTTILTKWNSIKASIKIAYLSMTAFIIPALILADSRTSLVAIFVSCIILCVKSEWFNKMGKKIKNIIILTIGLLLVVTVVSLYFYRPASANTRLLIWRVSKEMFSEKPLFGHGTGSYPSNYMYWQAEYFSNHPDSKFIVASNNHYQAFNEFIHIACEQGIIGLILFAVLLYLIFMTRGRLILKLCFITLLVASCFSYPFDVFPLMLLFPIFMGLLAPIDNIRSSFTFQIRPIAKLSFIVVFFGVLAATIVYRQQYHRTEEALHHFMLKKDARTDFIVRNNFGLIKKNMKFSFLYAKQVLEMNDSFYSLSVFQEITKYFVTSDMMIDYGKLHQERKEYQEAKKCFVFAHFMTPSRILPRYHLFKLYEEMGDTYNAIITAKKILVQPVSVVGSITLRTRKEMKDYLLIYLPK